MVKSPGGRPVQWPEQMLLRLPEGTMARIEAVSFEGETRNDFVRQAVERALAVREGTKNEG